MKTNYGLLVAALTLLVSSSRADVILDPSASTGVEQVNSTLVTYNSVDGGVVGQGSGLIAATVVFESLETFDLSSVSTPITGATVTGSFSDFTTRYQGNPFPPGQYGGFSGSIFLATAPPPSDPAALFSYIQGGHSGFFNVDNGVADANHPDPVGGNFSITLGASDVAALEAARAGGTPVYVGFYVAQPLAGVSVFASFTTSLDIPTAVPEPSAMALLGAGLALLALRRRRKAGGVA